MAGAGWLPALLLVWIRLRRAARLGTQRDFPARPQHEPMVWRRAHAGLPRLPRNDRRLGLWGGVGKYDKCGGTRLRATLARARADQ